MSKLLLSITTVLIVFSTNIYAADQRVSYPATRWCIATPTLRVRSLPSTEGEITDKIPYGVQVLVLGEESDQQTIGGKTGRWVEIEFHGRLGYAFDAFFSSQEPTIKVEGIEKKTAALVNGFIKDENHCGIELVDGQGKAFVETANSVDLCNDELLGKRVKISYEPNTVCKKGNSCPKITIHELNVIPLR